MSRFDAVVVGAGPAGTTTAIALARAGLSVAVLEKAAFPRRKVCGEFISAAAWPLLDAAGVGAMLRERAGPDVRRVGFFCGDARAEAPMPAASAPHAFGRAIGRETLDTALAARARECGAVLLQPCAAKSWQRSGRHYRVATRDGRTFEAGVVIAANGSWERIGAGPAARDSDLLGFKAHFTATALSPGLMPLVLFPGGYGGLVHTDGGRVSFSCCIRRDVLRACRAANGERAGDAVLAHVMRHCDGVREALQHARREGAWLAAGPLRPGIRVGGVAMELAVGNAAGEAHPLVAEGISMAIQSASLLAEEIVRAGALDARSVETIRTRYAKRWRGELALRVRASQAFAALAGTHATLAATRVVVRRAPALLAWGAMLSGKARLPEPAPR